MIRLDSKKEKKKEERKKKERKRKREKERERKHKVTVWESEIQEKESYHLVCLGETWVLKAVQRISIVNTLFWVSAFLCTRSERSNICR